MIWKRRIQHYPYEMIKPISPNGLVVNNLVFKSIYLFKYDFSSPRIDGRKFWTFDEWFIIVTKNYFSSILSRYYTQILHPDTTPRYYTKILHQDIKPNTINCHWTFLQRPSVRQDARTLHWVDSHNSYPDQLCLTEVEIL